MLHGIPVASDVAQGMMGKPASKEDFSDQARPGFSHLKNKNTLTKTPSVQVLSGRLRVLPFIIR